MAANDVVNLIGIVLLAPYTFEGFSAYSVEFLSTRFQAQICRDCFTTSLRPDAGPARF